MNEDWRPTEEEKQHQRNTLRIAFARLKSAVESMQAPSDNNTYAWGTFQQNIDMLETVIHYMQKVMDL